MRHYVISSVFVILAGSAAADIPLVMHDLNDYGFVWDLNLGHGSPDDPIWGEDRCGLNNNSCVPTSWTNCLVYLQNKYESELAGLEIAGAGNDYYNAWSETVATLRSPEFMNTTVEDPGTTPYGQVNGIEQFLIHQGAGPLATSYQAIAANFMLEEFASAIPPGEAYPEWLMRGAPDLHQLNQWLIEDAAVVIDVLWEAEGEPDGRGHALALVGMDSWAWNGRTVMTTSGWILEKGRFMSLIHWIRLLGTIPPTVSRPLAPPNGRQWMYGSKRALKLQERLAC